MTPTAKLTLDSAAAASNKRLPDFLLDAALDAAFDTLLDRRVFHLDDKHWDALLVALAVPPRNNPGLRKLLSRKPAWGQ
jgi:uncharacterized protein (DUF1778 family)